MLNGLDADHCIEVDARFEKRIDALLDAETMIGNDSVKLGAAEPVAAS